MTTTEKQLEQLRRAYESGIIDQTTYESALKGFGVDIRDSQIGVLGDHAIIEGGINFYGGKEDPKGLLRRYLNDLAADTNRLPLGRLSPEQAGPDQGDVLRLSDVYTALDTTEPEQMDCEDDVRRCLARQEKLKRISAQQMINDHARLVLLGDPGSGKTTVVNFITHVMACAGVSKEPQECLSRLRKTGAWDHGPLLPIRIILRDFAAWMESEDGDNRTITAWVRKILGDAGLEDLWPVFHEGLQDQSSPFLILLDGLDEVPGAIRQEVVRMIDDFTNTYEHNRYLVTCRIYAYVDPAYRLRRFRQTILAPFSDEQINQFIDAWYSELAFQKRISEPEAIHLSERLKVAIGRSDLKALAERPLIMTVMTLLHTSYGRLPEDRVELYQWAVDLLFRRWKGHIGQGEKGLMATLKMPQLKMSDLLAGLYHAAFQAHAGQGRAEGTADIAEEVLMKQLKPYLGDDWNRAETFIRYVRERAGLLIRHKPDAYTFPHRTFQEFMAACHLAGLKDYPREAARLVKKDLDLWRIVFVLAAGHAARTQLGNAISSVCKLCIQRVMEVENPDAAAFTRAVISAEALLEIGLAGVKREEDGRVLLDLVRQWLIAAMAADDVLEARERVDAGNLLAQLGDPRFDPQNRFLPDDGQLGFVEIPGGPFVMGKGKDRHEVALSAYAMSKYPVTVAQFKAFAADTGRELDEDWDRFNRLDNHPVVVVCWHDAFAYCEWLTRKLKNHGYRVMLPTEAQWEKAARGTDERKYPWGNEDIDREKANYKNSGISSTSPVGCFPRGKSAHGLHDMAGNVWEWCMDRCDYDWVEGIITDTFREGITDPVCKKGAARVLRGGAWLNLAGLCRAAYRITRDPDTRDHNLGFRLVRLPAHRARWMPAC